MPGKPCAVAVCKNTDRSPIENLSFHRFPKDSKLRKVWIRNCKRKDEFNPETSRICSVHFRGEDFENDMRSNLMGLPSKRILKKNSIPLLELMPAVTGGNSSSVSDRKKRMLAKEMAEKHHAIMQDLLISPRKDIQKNEVMPEVDYKELYFNTLKEKDLLVTQLQEKTLELQLTVQELNISRSVENEANSALNKVFTENEITMLLGKQKRVHWSDDEISNAFTLRYLSRRAYVFLRQKKGFPLPGLSTLRHWAGKVSLRNGILDDILRMMKVASQDLKISERLCVLSFDELKIRETLEYDEHEDEVIGPHKQLQVVMVRSLIRKWKQPVYLNFDTKITKNILMEIIVRLHEIGFMVVACVSDCGGGNIGLWKELQLTTDQPHFQHPITDDRIVYSPDVPHLLKLLRNWLLDTGFSLYRMGQKSISRPLHALLDVHLASSEINVCPKFKEKHLICEGVQMWHWQPS